MRLLFDTQLLLWWLGFPARVPLSARALVESADGPVYVSLASLWEVCIKVSIGKLRLDVAQFYEQASNSNLDWLPISPLHLLQVASLPMFADHRDPFDRLLVAQSLSEPVLLLTTDSKLARYGSTVRLV